MLEKVKQAYSNIAIAIRAFKGSADEHDQIKKDIELIKQCLEKWIHSNPPELQQAAASAEAPALTAAPVVEAVPVVSAIKTE